MIMSDSEVAFSLRAVERDIAEAARCARRDPGAVKLIAVSKTVPELAIEEAQWRVVGRQRLNRSQFTRYLTQTSPLHVVMEGVNLPVPQGRQRPTPSSAAAPR